MSMDTISQMLVKLGFFVMNYTSLFLGGPANGNLARGSWDALSSVVVEGKDNGDE